MNKTELEKMFDEKFVRIAEDMPIFGEGNKFYELTDIKQFIFETVIHEVFKDISLSNETCLCCQNNKQKAKELYGIDLF